MAWPAKLLWMREQAPELWKSAARFVGLHEVVVAGLARCAPQMSRSMASGTGLWNLERQAWDEELLQILQLDPERLPPVVEPDAVVGELGGRALLLAGGGDGPLSNLGTGAHRPGAACLSVGTSGALRVSRAGTRTDPTGRTFCFLAVDDLWVIGGAVSNGTLATEWVRTMVGNPPLEQLLGEAWQVAPGSEGLVFLPYLVGERAPHFDLDARGRLDGLQRHHGPAQLCRAAAEGVCFGLREILESIPETIEGPIRACGGFALSLPWVQMMADVLGRPVSTVDGEEAGALGAAALAARAADSRFDLLGCLDAPRDRKTPAPAGAISVRLRRGFRPLSVPAQLVTHSPLVLLGVAAGGVGSLLVMVMVLRIQAFVALLTASLGVGLAAGMSGPAILEAIRHGVGNTLADVAVVVGLGSMFGQMLQSSGGARRIADTLIETFGAARAAFALALAGFLIAVPTMFEVGFIVMVPLVFSLQRRSGRPLLGFAMPLLAGLTAGHAFVPPTAAPVAVANILGADLGRVILFGICSGLPTALVVGPLFGVWLARTLPEVGQDPAVPATADEPEAELPSFALVIGLVLFPIALIVLRTFWLSTGHTGGVLELLGSPVVALLLATLLSFYLLGIRRGLARHEVQGLANVSLHSAGLIMLVIGGGGIFKQVLIDSGIGKALAGAVGGLGLSPLLMAFVLATVVRVSQGSTIVAMMTAAGLVSGLGGDPAQMTIALAAGGVMFSHVNDAGFWLVKEYLGLTEAQTLRSWTLLTGALGLTALGCLLVAARVLH